jgi:hypothetical protein
VKIINYFLKLGHSRKIINGVGDIILQDKVLFVAPGAHPEENRQWSIIYHELQQLVLGHMCHFNTHIALKFSNWRLIFLYYI